MAITNVYLDQIHHRQLTKNIPQTTLPSLSEPLRAHLVYWNIFPVWPPRFHACSKYPNTQLLKLSPYNACHTIPVAPLFKLLPSIYIGLYLSCHAPPNASYPGTCPIFFLPTIYSPLLEYPNFLAPTPNFLSSLPPILPFSSLHGCLMSRLFGSWIMYPFTQLSSCSAYFLHKIYKTL